MKINDSQTRIEAFIVLLVEELINSLYSMTLLV